MSHPIPSETYPCEFCGHQPDDCICEDIENGVARRLPDDEYYRDQQDYDEDYIPYDWS